MPQQALICFHPSGKYLYSTNYLHIKEGQLKELDSSELKVFQIDYDFGQNHLEQGEALYQSHGLQIYLPKEYELLDEIALKEKIKEAPFTKNTEFQPLVTQKKYFDDLNKILEKISLGYFYQVNYTIPFKAYFQGESLGVFNKYHKKFQGDFHAHLPGENYSIISFSPELFLMKEKNILSTKPIKGTAKEKEVLLKSQKENAELSMIVDLLRNDLNSVADLQASKVLKHREILDLGHLLHTYSEIQAQSSKKLSVILEHMLPGGSISGCPKKEACLALSNLESYKRQAYTGIIGLSEGENALMSIAIRTFIANNQGELFYHSGGGIVFDSNPQEEYEELLLKASTI